MFVAEALFDFSEAVLKNAQEKEKDQPLYKKQPAQDQEPAQQLDKGKRKRSEDHDRQLKKQGGELQRQNKQTENQKQKEQETAQYLNFEKGQKILVQHAYENGWWYGHAIKRPSQNGFFPSNYVKVGAKPPPPPPPKKNQESQQQQEELDSEQRAEWINKKLNDEKEGQPKVLTSDYYQGITGFKYVKINDNNKNILKANYVQFDVNTGLARVPVKDQAPTAKAVRQMGYYFDYHQWNEQKNKDPEAWKSKPDPSKKNKKKKLYLKGMGKDA